MKFQNESIRVIPFEASHWQHVYKWANSGSYNFFFGNSGPFTTDQCAQFNARGVNFTIVNANDVREIVGMISVCSLEERSRNFCYNVLIDELYQKKGFAREASKFALFYMFNNMNYNKAIALVCDENDGSKKLTESFGFGHEATLKQEVYIDGDYKDVNRYCMFKRDFNKKYKQGMENLV